MQARAIRLTDTAVKRLPHPKRGEPPVIVGDSDIGGFHLRVSDKGMVWKLKIDVRRGGKRATRGFTLGKWPVVNADTARQMAEDIVRSRDRGELGPERAAGVAAIPITMSAAATHDPCALIPKSENDHPRAKPRALYEADRNTHPDEYRDTLAGAQARYDADKTGLTLLDGWILFKDALHNDGKTDRTTRFYSGHMRRHLNKFHYRPLASISADEVRATHAALSTCGKKATANQVVITGGAIYTFASKGLQVPGLSQRAPWTSYRLFHKLKPRQKGIASANLSAWWEAVEKLSPVLREANLFCLLSALRGKNLFSLRLSQINWNECYVAITDTKSGIDFKLPLSAPMVDCLRRAVDASRIVHEINAETWVFASVKSDSGHIKKLNNLNAKHCAPTSSHPLRSTWRGAADQARIPGTHSKILMNHAVPSDVHSEYLTIDSMFGQLRESQDAVSALIMRSLSSGTSEVQRAAA